MLPTRVNKNFFVRFVYYMLKFFRVLNFHGFHCLQKIFYQQNISRLRLYIHSAIISTLLFPIHLAEGDHYYANVSVTLYVE